MSHHGRLRRSAVVIAIVTLTSVLTMASGAGAAPSTPAPATAPDAPVVTGEACAPGQGVTVVVDFQVEGDVSVGCAPGAQATGFAALTAAGFTYNEDSGPSPFLCQIGHIPATIEPDCWTTGYWAYWKSDGTANWDYSMVGADGGPIAAGSVEGWSWTTYEGGSYDGKLPRISVADLGALVPACDSLIGTGGEQAALRWTGCELERNGGTFPGFGTAPDFGLTLDAVMAYALDGKADDRHAAKALDIVGDRILEYVSDAGFGDGTTERYAGALAKSTLAFSLAGRNVHDVNGIDLEAELRARMNTTGPDTGRFSDHSQWGDYSNGIGQALAITALSHTESGVPAASVEFLLRQQCPGGGFRGSYDASPSCTTATQADTDYTSFAIQALISAEQTAQVRLAENRAVTFLIGQQDAQGGVSGTGVTAGANANSTGLAAQALRAVGRTNEATMARDWVRGHQLDATDAAGGPAVDDLGGIAYNQAAFTTGVASGITAGVRDQWRRATVQGLLAFDAPAYGTPGGESAAFPFDTWEQFVDRQFLDLYGRAPTARERTVSVAILSCGAVLPGEFIDWMVTVDPTSVDSRVFRYYFGLLDRLPTPANLSLWQGRVRAGWSSSRIAGEFLATADSPFRGTTNAQFVNLLYARVLGRTPSAWYTNFWTTRIANGSWSRAQVAAHFVETAEARDRNVEELRLLDMDRKMLGVLPTTARFVPQRDALRTGSKTFAGLAQEILTDAQYLDRITRLGM